MKTKHELENKDLALKKAVSAVFQCLVRGLGLVHTQPTLYLSTWMPLTMVNDDDVREKEKERKAQQIFPST